MLKKRKKWPLILLGVIAVVVIIMVATSGGKSSTSAPASDQPRVRVAAEPRGDGRRFETALGELAVSGFDVARVECEPDRTLEERGPVAPHVSIRPRKAPPKAA